MDRLKPWFHYFSLIQSRRGNRNRLDQGTGLVLAYLLFLFILRPVVNLWEIFSYSPPGTRGDLLFQQFYILALFYPLFLVFNASRLEGGLWHQPLSISSEVPFIHRFLVSLSLGFRRPLVSILFVLLVFTGVMASQVPGLLWMFGILLVVLGLGRVIQKFPLPAKEGIWFEFVPLIAQALLNFQLKKIEGQWELTSLVLGTLKISALEGFLAILGCGIILGLLWWGLWLVGSVPGKSENPIKKFYGLILPKRLRVLILGGQTYFLREMSQGPVFPPEGLMAFPVIILALWIWVMGQIDLRGGRTSPGLSDFKSTWRLSLPALPAHLLFTGASLVLSIFFWRMG